MSTVDQQAAATPAVAVIESLIREKGGRRIPFGSNAASAVTYHFKPESGNADDLDVPHVCEVPDQNHAARLLSITEGFRLYSAKNVGLPSELKISDPGSYIPEDAYADILNLDANEVSTDWLSGYSRQKLGIVPTNKKVLREYLLKNYGVDPENDETANGLLRLILAEHIKAEKLAHENAGGNEKIGT